MVSVLLVFVLFGVIQVALLFYARTIVAASAADGARWAANADVDYPAGGAKATALIERGLNRSAAASVPCLGSASRDRSTGALLAQVHCQGTIRSVFMPVGSLVRIDVTARSRKESLP